MVVGIDQLRGVLEDLRASPRDVAAREPGTDPAAARAALSKGPIVMPFGGRAVRVELSDGGTRFSLLDPSYPLSTRVELAVIDTGAAARGGTGAGELRDALWEQLDLVLRYRRAEEGARATARSTSWSAPWRGSASARRSRRTSWRRRRLARTGSPSPDRRRAVIRRTARHGRGETRETVRHLPLPVVP